MHNRLALYRLFTFFTLFIFQTSVYGKSSKELPEFNDWMALIKSSTENDSTITHHEKQVEIALMEGDTLAAINNLRELGSLYTSRVDYGDSYDTHWKLIMLAEASGDSISLARAYNGMSILYSLYERRDVALDYIEKSLVIRKELVAKGKAEQKELGSSYFPLAIHYRFSNDLQRAKIYLDSCKLYWSTGLLVRAEDGYQAIWNGNYEKARKQLIPIEDSIANNLQSYMVIFYSNLGDLHLYSKNYDKAIEYYSKSILNGYEHLRHLNYIPDIYLQLAKAYQSIGDFRNANKYLITGNKINEWLYSSRSENNRYLLEIKDDVRIAKEKKEKLLKEQRITQLEHEQQVWWLRTIIISVSTIFLGVMAIIWFRRIRRKHKEEQAKLEQKRKEEDAKNKEILSIKNRELTNSTLQIIAKDELLSDLKEDLDKLQKSSNSKEVQSLINNIKVNKDISWLEFENRFTAVNSDFFEKLKEQFPHLKPYDHKICALIKLNFSGKEMAKLLGISPESANTSRYRLRKRLGLKKEDNLVEFIDSI
ncbi:tetratricopeptide repeat protein [Reichenbachiella versicolor]|uniref:tetratricopeptide repeat protein n=1 Tax=Reichenbachiella versicolor TaxID=1821036 RepID=UPI000D6E2B69|nr:tetratricopeptide repeat protein [Reichenbachiella versicolor]